MLCERGEPVDDRLVVDFDAFGKAETRQKGECGDSHPSSKEFTRVPTKADTGARQVCKTFASIHRQERVIIEQLRNEMINGA